jgi:hypothetical protein
MHCKNIILFVIIILLLILIIYLQFCAYQPIPNTYLTQSLLNNKKREHFIQPNIQNTQQPDILTKPVEDLKEDVIRENIQNYSKEFNIDVSELGTNKGNISKPSYFDKVTYRPIICPNNVKKIIKEKENNVTCSNDSLNYLHSTGQTFLEKNKLMETNCGQEEKEEKEEEEFDPATYYKKFNKPFSAQLEDPCFKGYNYVSYSNKPRYLDVGHISLERSNKYPVGINYAFNNSGIDI